MQLNVELIPNGARICSAHFTENDFKIVHGRRILAPNALPHIERAIEDTQNDIIMPSTSASDTSKVDRATSPIPGCSDFVDQSTSMSPKKEENSLEKEYLQKQLQDTRNFI
ncbi:uncharacterized protein LOC143216478 [Lasioglossum baleicum]|uniref:uncharacterized protein LOC143216478 n=1 Tax=Lasioglossum baleicum TaxID=434251 RepID=UPI003FCE7A1A